MLLRRFNIPLTDEVVRDQVNGFVGFIREHAIVGLAVGFIIGTYINTTTKKKRLAALRRKHFGDGRPSNMGGRPEDYPPPPMGSNPPY